MTNYGELDYEITSQIRIQSNKPQYECSICSSVMSNHWQVTGELGGIYESCQLKMRTCDTCAKNAFGIE